MAILQVTVVVKNLPANVGDIRNAGLNHRPGRAPGEGSDNPLLICLPGKFHGQKSLAGCSPWGVKESDMAEHRLL